MSGSAQLRDSMFGDPAYGEVKIGSYKPTDPIATRNALTAMLAWDRNHVAGVQLLAPAQLNTLRVPLHTERGYFGQRPIARQSGSRARQGLRGCTGRGQRGACFLIFEPKRGAARGF